MRRQDSKRQCVKCQYLMEEKTCKAFPNGIPGILLSGFAEHDEIIDGQEGTFIYEPKEEFREKDREQREINKEKQISSLFEIYTKQLPKLVLKEITRLGYNIELFDEIEFKAKMPYKGPYEAELIIAPKRKIIKLGNDRFSPEFEIFTAFRVIDSIEKIIKKSNNGIHLIVFNDGGYKYLDASAHHSQ